MKKHYGFILTAGLILAIIISNAASVISGGLSLDKLRGSVLRLHILANSDSEYDQRMKLKVRDALLESGILSGASSLDEAQEKAQKKLEDIETLAELTLEESGCNYPVRAMITDMDFDEREYGDITMPSGNYKTLRIEIGEAKGHNWWCVMYPPLCVPAACEVDDNEEAEEAFFDRKERDILKRPEKYRVRFAVWDKLKSIRDKKHSSESKCVVESDEKRFSS